MTERHHLEGDQITYQITGRLQGIRSSAKPGHLGTLTVQLGTGKVIDLPDITDAVIKVHMPADSPFQAGATYLDRDGRRWLSIGHDMLVRGGSTARLMAGAAWNAFGPFRLEHEPLPAREPEAGP